MERNFGGVFTTVFNFLALGVIVFQFASLICFQAVGFEADSRSNNSEKVWLVIGEEYNI